MDNVINRQLRVPGPGHYYNRVGPASACLVHASVAKLRSTRFVSFTISKETSKSFEAIETWMLFELYQADNFCGDPWKSAVPGGRTRFKKGNAGNAHLLSKAQTSAIVCANLFDAMAIVRQRKSTTPCKEFLPP